MSRGVRQAASSHIVNSPPIPTCGARKRIDHTRAAPNSTADPIGAPCSRHDRAAPVPFAPTTSHIDNMRWRHRLSAVDQRDCGAVIIW
jgi:hypothetical protein